MISSILASKADQDSKIRINYVRAGMSSIYEPVSRRARGLLNNADKITGLAEVMQTDIGNKDVAVVNPDEV